MMFVLIKPDLSSSGYSNRCFLVAMCCQIARRPNWKQQQREASPSAAKNIRAVLVPCRTWKCVPVAISGGVDIAVIPRCHCCNRQVLSESKKNYVKDQFLMNSHSTLPFLTLFLTQLIYNINKKYVNQITLNDTTL